MNGRNHLSVAVCPDPHPLPGCSPKARGMKDLSPRYHKLDRPPETPRRDCRHRSMRTQRGLLAETSTDEGGNHPNLIEVQSQLNRQAVSHTLGILRRLAYDEGLAQPLGDSCEQFHRIVMMRRGPVLGVDNDFRRLENLVSLPDDLVGNDRKSDRFRLTYRLEAIRIKVDVEWIGFIFRGDFACGLVRGLKRLRDDHRNRLATIGNAVGLQWLQALKRMAASHVKSHRLQGLHCLMRQDQQNTRDAFCGVGVDLHYPALGNSRRHQHRVRHHWRSKIRGIARATRDLVYAVDPLRIRANSGVDHRHALLPAIISASATVSAPSSILNTL